MSQLKAASLTSSLLAAKGRASPAALVEQMVSDGRAPRGEARSPEMSRWDVVDALVRENAPRAREPLPQPSVVVSLLPTPAGEEDRHINEHAQRKKLSLRLDPQRHFRLKLVSYHLGLSAQELLTRALDRYIELVAPELGHAMPMAGGGLRHASGNGADDHHDAAATGTTGAGHMPRAE